MIYSMEQRGFTAVTIFSSPEKPNYNKIQF